MTSGLAQASAPAGHLPTPDAIMGRAREENFPVASRLLSRDQRRHLLAIYGFARLVDNIGDEARGDRNGLLDSVERELDQVYAGEPRHPLMRSLAATVRACNLPRTPFDDLIAANRQDQQVEAYETFADLEGYCMLSANPVGELVLRVFGAATPRRLALSNRICTALQLAEHWQDIPEDLERGRVYLPEEDLRRFGCSRADLAARPAPGQVRQLLRFEVERARGILETGTPLVRTLRGRSRLAVAAFVAGGRAAFQAIERAGYDVSQGPPRTSRAARANAWLATVTAIHGETR